LGDLLEAHVVAFEQRKHHDGKVLLTMLTGNNTMKETTAPGLRMFHRKPHVPAFEAPQKASALDGWPPSLFHGWSSWLRMDWRKYLLPRAQLDDIQGEAMAAGSGSAGENTSTPWST